MWRHLGCSSGSLGSRLHWSPRGGVEPTGSNFDRIRNASPAEGIPLQFRKDGDLGTSPFLSSSRSRCSSRPASGYSILYRSGKRREGEEGRPSDRFLREAEVPSSLAL